MQRAKIKQAKILLFAVFTAAFILALAPLLLFAPRVAAADSAAPGTDAVALTEISDAEKFKKFLTQDEKGVTNADILGIKNLNDKIFWKPYAIFNNDGRLTEIDISELKDGKAVHGTLDLAGCTSLIQFSCQNSLLTRLNLSGCTALETLYCDGNQLAALDVSGCDALEVLGCGRNKLVALDVSGNAALQELYCGGNQLTELDVSNLGALTKLYCGGNKLASLKISNCGALEALYCYNNKLKSLAVSGLNGLKELGAHRNSFADSALKEFKGRELEYLSYTDNGDGLTYCVIREWCSSKTLTVKCIGEGYVVGRISGESIELYINPDDGYQFVEWKDQAGLVRVEWKAEYYQADFDGDIMSVTAIFGKLPLPAALIGGLVILSICALELGIFALLKFITRRNSLKLDLAG